MPVRLYRIFLTIGILALVLLACQITLQTTSAPPSPAPKTVSPTVQPPTAIQETTVSTQPAEIPTESLPSQAAPTEAIPVEATPLPTQEVILPIVPSSPGEKPAHYAYELQPGSPQAIPNFAHPEQGCDWLGVAGQVFNEEQEPINGLVVEVTGTLEGKEIFLISLTGVEKAYGEGGYEVVLANRGIDSKGSLILQLLSTGGEQLSEKVAIETHADCEHNLTLVNFVAAKPVQALLYYFPIIEKR